MENGRMTHTVLFDTVKTQSVEWLWYPYIPYGKLSLLQGDPGEGKTSLALKLAAVISSGGNLPDGTKADRCGMVLYQAMEDSPSDTLKPRLTCFGADCGRIAFLKDTDYFPSLLDERELTDLIESMGIRLLILDPVQAFLCLEAEQASVRKKMTALSKAAENTGCAIVMIGHMNKNENGKDLYRGLGSIDVVAAARSVLTVERVGAGSSARVIRHIKSSLAAAGCDFGFEITDDGNIEWIGPIEKEKEDIALQSAKRSGAKYEMAKELLLKWLSGDDLPFSEIMGRFKDAGISQRTVSDAKKDIGIKSIKTADGWLWHLEKESHMELSQETDGNA